MQARDTARFIGLRDRGTLEVGMRADLNVVELSRLALLRPTMQQDLPAGGKRLVQRAARPSSAASRSPSTASSPARARVTS
jgi:N-acyl-D-aspartate/D-glutamate deacylase